MQAFAQYKLLKPLSVPLPLPLSKPFVLLSRPRKAFICDKPECERISVSCNEIQKHYYKAHDWKSSSKEQEH